MAQFAAGTSAPVNDRLANNPVSAFFKLLKEKLTMAVQAVKTKLDDEMGADSSLDERTRLARSTMTFAFAALGALGLFAIGVIGIKEPDASRFQSIKDLFGLILPMIGTWAGTVLAFYFSQRNFEAATKSTLELHRQFMSPEGQLETIIVTDAMKNIDNIPAKVVFKKDETDATYTLQQLIDILEKGDPKGARERLPILDDEGHPKYMVHHSLIDRFIVQNIADPKAKDLKLEDLVKKNREILTAFRTVAPTANLAMVKVFTDNVPNCRDVFVTDDGTSKTRVRGWITNQDIEEHARL